MVLNIQLMDKFMILCYNPEADTEGQETLMHFNMQVCVVSECLGEDDASLIHLNYWKKNTMHYLVMLIPHPPLWERQGGYYICKSNKIFILRGL